MLWMAFLRSRMRNRQVSLLISPLILSKLPEVYIMTLMETFDNFILSRELSDLSKKSIMDYRQFIKPFIAFIGLSRDFQTVTQDDINSYLQTLLKKPISKSSRATYIRHLKIFLRWSELQYGASFQAKLIKIPKSPKRSVRIYSDDDIKVIFDTIHSDVPWLTYRNKAIIALMYDSGIRQAEVCNLKRGKIDFSNNRMVVYGKGNKERIVPLGKHAIYFMRLYMDTCPFENEYLFVNRRGCPLTCNAVKLFVSKLAAKLPFELSSHKLRHNFATNYCIDQYDKYGQIDIFRLMYLMGHEDIETTNRYLHFAMEIISARGAISHLDNIMCKG